MVTLVVVWRLHRVGCVVFELRLVRLAERQLVEVFLNEDIIGFIAAGDLEVLQAGGDLVVDRWSAAWLADGVGEALLLLLVCAGPDVLVQLAL